MELLYQVPQSPDTRRGFPPSMKKLPNLHLIFTPYSDAFRMFQTLLEFLMVIWSDPFDFWPPSRTQVRILRVSGTLLPLYRPPQSLDNRRVFPPSMKKQFDLHLIIFLQFPAAFASFRVPPGRLFGPLWLQVGVGIEGCSWRKLRVWRMLLLRWGNDHKAIY